MEIKEIQFFQGLTIINDVPCTLVPLNTSLAFFKKLLENTNYSLFSKEKIKKLAYFTGSYLLNNQKLTISKKINLFLEDVGNYGFGEFKLLSSTSEKFIIVSKSPIFHNFYRNLFKEELKNESYFAESLIKSFLEILFGKVFDMEIQLKNKSLHLTLNKTQLEMSTSKESLEVVIKKEKNLSSNRLLKKVLLDNQYKIVGGNICIWNIYLVGIPFFLFENLDESQNLKLKKILIELGEIQGEIATHYQKVRFGRKDRKELVESIIMQSELVGLGKLKTIEHNEKEIKFEMTNDFLTSNPFAWYLLGLIMGCMQYISKKKSFGTYSNNLYSIKQTSGEIEENEDKKVYKELMALEKIIVV